jgi:nicotinamidase-related amidase
MSVNSSGGQEMGPYTALLVMDVQQSVAERFAGEALLGRLSHAVASARGAGVPVIFVRVAFREGAPEVNARNAMLSAVAADPAFHEDGEGTEMHPAVAPRPGESVVTKRRVNAFYGTDLQLVLGSRSVTRLVLCGVATSGVVLSTLRDAADRDYEVIVLADACGDGDAEVHRVLMDKVFPTQARVCSVDEWAAALP